MGIIELLKDAELRSLLEPLRAGSLLLFVSGILLRVFLPSFSWSNKIILGGSVLFGLCHLTLMIIGGSEEED